MAPSPALQESAKSPVSSPVANTSAASALPRSDTNNSLEEARGFGSVISTTRDQERLAEIRSGEENRSGKRQKAPNTAFRPLLPALGPRTESQLPTPQSPNSMGTYAESLAHGVESPLRKTRISSTFAASSTGDKSGIPFSETTSLRVSLMTPESSPVHTRRPRSPFISSPPTTPPRHPANDFESSETSGLLARAASLSRTIPSGLSSPFVPERRLSAKSTPRRSREPSPAHREDALSPASTSSAATTPPPLTAPVPQRAVSTEFQHIRFQMAADQAARLEEAESRRPEYLKRTKRPPSRHNDIATGDEENTHPSLGVIDSPVKGRRLALFQETSEESFEQSLLAGGYPLYGRTPAYVEPAIPMGSGKVESAFVDDHGPHGISNEKELQKRRRLAAFRDHNSVDTHAKLYPVILEGLGRVLLDHLPPDTVLQNGVLQKRRGGRKRKGPVLESPAKRVLGSPGKRMADLPQQGKETAKPNWPDEVFPWSLSTQQRTEYAKKEEEDRLRRIERYLERDSDEDEDNDDQSLGLPPVEEDSPTARRGRGKMVPLSSDPHNTPHSANAKRANTMIPSDPADARAALLSKRSVRALAHRRRQRERRTICICRGKDDGRELVQCDDCHKWFHLECMGIDDVSDLGREEDPWYCNDCLGVERHAPTSSPTFVPTDDRLPANRKRGDLFFPGTVQESPPGIVWNTPVRPPRTPPRESDLTHNLSSRSSFGGSSQLGPHTPSTSAHSVRIYNEPGPAPFLETLDEPFDPSATPSRGMKFSGPFTTPKPPASWSYRGGMMQTPSRMLKRSSGTFPFTFESNDASSPTRTVYTNNDESPVRRSNKTTLPRHPPGSPLASRAPAFPVFGSQPSLSTTTRGSSFEQLRAAGSAPS